VEDGSRDMWTVDRHVRITNECVNAKRLREELKATSLERTSAVLQKHFSGTVSKPTQLAI
jgi:hypothetical protein